MHWATRIVGKNSTALPEHLSKVIKPGPVIMISTETTPGTIKFDCLFGLKVHILESDPLWCQCDPLAFRLDNPDNVKELIYWLRRIQPSLCVFDPLQNSHGADENNAGEMVKIIQPLQQYSINNDMAMVIVHHDKKPPEKAKHEDILKPEMARGTGALFGLADGLLAQVVTSMDTEFPQLLMAGKYKRGKPFTEEVELNCDWAAHKLDTEVASLVYNIIHDSPADTDKIADLLKLKDTEVLRYTHYMYKNKIINKTPNDEWEIGM